MVPAVATSGFPSGWPNIRKGWRRSGSSDNGSIVHPDRYRRRLPAGTRSGTEPAGHLDHGLLAVHVRIVDKHALELGPAERADVIVDFSNYAGKTLIMYNDAPAAFPNLDLRRL